MTAKPDLNAWTPELGPGEMHALGRVLDALNAAEERIANGDIGLNLAGVLEVTIDAETSRAGSGFEHVGIIQPIDAAAWVFTPGDAERRVEWGAWVFLPWPEETIRRLIDAARALCPPTPPGATRLTSLVVEGEEQIDPRREALRDALDALDKSTYVLCAKRQHVVRGDHHGPDKEGEPCDHKPDDDD